MLDGIVLGVLTFGGFYLIYRKSWWWVKWFVVKLQLVFDVLATYGTYLLLSEISSSFGVAIGCAIVGILVSLYLSTQEKEGQWKKPQKTQPAQP